MEVSVYILFCKRTDTPIVISGNMAFLLIPNGEGKLAVPRYTDRSFLKDGKKSPCVISVTVRSCKTVFVHHESGQPF